MQHFNCTCTEGIVAGSFALRNIILYHQWNDGWTCPSSAFYRHVQVNNMEDSDLHGGATSLAVSLCPAPHLSLCHTTNTTQHPHPHPRRSEVSVNCYWHVMSEWTLLFPPTLSPSLFRSNELALMRADAVVLWPTFCLSVFGLWCFICSLCVFLFLPPDSNNICRSSE